MNDDKIRLKSPLANRFLGSILLCLSLSLPFSFLRIPVTGLQLGNISHLLEVVVLGVFYAFRKRIGPDRLFLATMGIVMLFIPVGFIHLGPLTANMLLAPFVPLLFRIVYGPRAAWFGLAYILLVISFFGILFCTSRLSLNFDLAAYMRAPQIWLYNIFNIALATIMFFSIYTPAEVRVMEKQAWFNAIFDGVNDAIFIRDAATGTVIDINQRVIELFGYTREEALAGPIGFLSADIAPHTRSGIAEKFQQAILEGYATFDWHVRRKDGSLLWVEGDMRKLRIGDADVVIIAIRDNTARKGAEEALRESEDKYRQVFEMESDAHFLIEKETGRILEVNSAACSLYGYSREDLLTMKNFDLSAEPRDTAHQTKTEGTLIPVRYHKKADGSVFPVEITAGHFTLGGRRVHLAAIRDISFRQKIEEQLQQAKKMESIGRLAGGIAHDFNNLLSPIMGFSELMLKSGSSDSPHREWLKSILKAAERARDLTRQLLAFSRKQVLVIKPVALETVLKGLEQILRRTIREDIHIETSFQPRIGIVRADVGQIEQILMNLALNAQDAMPQGGFLRLGLSETMFRPIGAEAPSDAVATPHVMLSVSDTGCGMEQDVLQHLFEPFFTTKEKGKGTGLGLSITQKIIEEHHGTISVTSKVGIGTTFTLRFPRA